MNIFNFELKKSWRSILWWGLSIALLYVMFIGIYPTTAQNAEAMDLILKYYPPEYLAAFGLSETLSIASLSGYNSFTFSFMQLILAIHASYLGFSYLSIEEREMTADFLFTKPASRSTIFLYKTGAALVSLFVIGLLSGIGIILAFVLFPDDQNYTTSLGLLFISIPLFQLTFFTTGMLLTTCLKKIKSVLSFSLGLSFAMYSLNSLRAIIDKEIFGIISPFYHMEPQYVFNELSLRWPLVIFGLMYSIGAGVVAYHLYKRRNIAVR